MILAMAISLFISLTDLISKGLFLYELQNLHLFQGQLRVARISNELDSLGGLMGPISKEYAIETASIS